MLRIMYYNNILMIDSMHEYVVLRTYNFFFDTYTVSTTLRDTLLFLVNIFCCVSNSKASVIQKRL